MRDSRHAPLQFLRELYFVRLNYGILPFLMQLQLPISFTFIERVELPSSSSHPLQLCLGSQVRNKINKQKSDHGTTPFIYIYIHIFCCFIYIHIHICIYIYTSMSVPKTWKIYIATSKVQPTPPRSNLFITSVNLRILRAATFGFPTFVTLDSVPVVHLATKNHPNGSASTQPLL